ncbi:MAG: hypothetical protein KA384_07535 [Leptotrichiaceae bacterium]|nr:hypothetical protein [Leptotrichiaceae bacterium]MBP6281881.1 hypothetical protein [Leptotrichiaceae bacterium]MBP7725702.1 hypothetical protein [Leptotrichiaceae bacterium]MBP9629735.1 hypothetical protein [Leptotrichiaceae bacterium]
MKVLKLLLVVLLLLIFGGLGIVFFQNNIISHMTKTEKSSFINAKYSIKTNEILFDGFIVNGKNLGKGRVTVNLEKSGAFGLIPKIKLKKMKLENLDLNSVYTAPNALIDGFMVKITSPIREEKVLKTTEEYLLESTKDIENLNLEIENFINDKIKTNIEKTNKIKEDYKASTNLKSKVENLSELNKEASPLIKSISDEKEKLEYAVSDIEVNKNIILTNMSSELKKLENKLSLNGVQNINSYIFLDKEEEIARSLNNALKIITLIDEIKNLSIEISDIEINKNRVIISKLNEKKSDITGEILLDNNVKVNVKGSETGYNLDSIMNDLSIKAVLEKDKKINATLTYGKKDILEGKIINLISDLVYENNNFQNINKTIFSEEDKKLLTEKTETIESTYYNEIMNQYSIQTSKIDELIEKIYKQKEKLDKIQKDLLVLNKFIELGEVAKISTEVFNSDEINNNQATEGQNNQQQNNQQNPKKQIQDMFR